MMISDVRMPGLSGLETLRRARQAHAILQVLLVTAYPDVRDAVAAMRDGAVNYLEKPIDLDELLATVRKAIGMEEEIPVKLCADKQLPEYVVARSPLMHAVFRDASLVARSDSRILITGESGVGKEVVADVIHAWSHRSAGPLIKVNCAAIPENLLESELFGHEKGSFTGAIAQRIGRFEEADQGTVLLDEIVEMSPHLQAKLLRITQDGRFQRVGSNQERRTHACSWRPPTGIWRRKWPAEISVKICSIGSTSWRFMFRRCGNARGYSAAGRSFCGRILPPPGEVFSRGRQLPGKI